MSPSLILSEDDMPVPVTPPVPDTSANVDSVAHNDRARAPMLVSSVGWFTACHKEVAF